VLCVLPVCSPVLTTDSRSPGEIYANRSRSSSSIPVCGVSDAAGAQRWAWKVPCASDLVSVVSLTVSDPRPAVRRKFFELYNIPAPPSTPLSRATSPSASPTKPDGTSPQNPVSPSAIHSDPFTHMLLELVRLIQACLAMWGMVSEELEIDGLFCDETKKGAFAWRKAMGMEHEESMRLEVSLRGRQDGSVQRRMSKG